LSRDIVSAVKCRIQDSVPRAGRIEESLLVVLLVVVPNPDFGILSLGSADFGRHRGAVRWLDTVAQLVVNRGLSKWFDLPSIWISWMIDGRSQ
jgi:hypothetical protein